MFHLRQCWTNYQKTVMRCNSSDFWKNHVKNGLQNLEVQFVSTILYYLFIQLNFFRLITTVDHCAVMAIIASYRTQLDQLAGDSTSAGAAHGGGKHLDYLITHWMPVEMWKSWSDFGRLSASSVLNILIDIRKLGKVRFSNMMFMSLSQHYMT